MAHLAFGRLGYASVKVSRLFNAASHAAQLAAGFSDDYAPLVSMLKKHKAGLNFKCVEPKALADPKGFVLQVLNAAWTAGVAVSSENADSCYDRQGHNKILQVAKPRKAPHGRHLCGFTYLELNQDHLQPHNLREFKLFVQRMLGDAEDSEEDSEEDSKKDLEEDSEDDSKEDSEEDVIFKTISKLTLSNLPLVFLP